MNEGTNRTEIFKSWGAASLGAIGVLLATALADNFAGRELSESLGWFGIWIIVEILTILPAPAMLLIPKITQGPLVQRMDFSFPHLVIGFLGIVTFAIRASFDDGILQSPWAGPLLVATIVGFATLLLVLYLFLRTSLVKRVNELFP